MRYKTFLNTVALLSGLACLLSMGPAFSQITNQLPNLERVFYAGETFVGVGQKGRVLLGRPERLTTNGPSGSDLFAWSLGVARTGVNLHDVFWGNGLWVGVGENGAVMTKRNVEGSTAWVTQSMGLCDSLKRVVFMDGNWAAVGSGGTILSSDNAFLAKWDSGSTNSLRDVRYGNGRWVSVGERDTILVSTNLTNGWSRANVPAAAQLADLKCVVYANNKWAAVGGASAGGGGAGVKHFGEILTSVDGVSWTRRVGSEVDADLSSLCYGNGLWVAAGTDGAILSSVDGLAWVKRDAGTTEALSRVSYGDGLWVIVGGGGVIATSTNGTDWQKHSAGTSAALADVQYGGGRWVAVGALATVVVSTNVAVWSLIQLRPSAPQKLRSLTP